MKISKKITHFIVSVIYLAIFGCKNTASYHNAIIIEANNQKLYGKLNGKEKKLSNLKPCHVDDSIGLLQNQLVKGKVKLSYYPKTRWQLGEKTKQLLDVSIQINKKEEIFIISFDSNTIHNEINFYYLDGKIVEVAGTLDCYRHAMLDIHYFKIYPESVR